LAIAQAGSAGSGSAFSCTSAIQPPLEVELDVVRQETLDGESGTADLQLSVTPLTESVRVSWEIVAPPALSTISGNLDGIEPATLGGTISHSLTLSVPDGHRYHVYARAVLETERGERYTRAVSRYIDLGEPDIEHPSFVRNDPQRGAVTSYRGIVIEGGDR
jgi:hypothetical protein